MGKAYGMFVDLTILAGVVLGSYVGGTFVRNASETLFENRRVARVLDAEWKDGTTIGERLDWGTQAVSIIGFTDYQCIYCRLFHTVLDSVLDANRALGIAIRHLPAPGHVEAGGAARAAICAGKQDRFRQIHRHLFTTTAWEADTDWVSLARSVGVPNLARFKNCLTAPATEERLRADLDLARRLGVQQAPALVTSRRIIRGYQTGLQLGQLLVKLAHPH